ncbi:MAG TPA: hypothetical protein VM124_01435 [Candidatus Limnocylindrales bacterium]|nr:hypothetical protein [Candidatus Limnocylindrales bacterium]
MENAQQILVIILGVMLALFLLLGIFALTKIIQLLDHLKRISEKAEKLADTAENIGEFFKYTAGPAAIGKLFANITSVVLKRKKSGRHDYE